VRAVDGASQLRLLTVTGIVTVLVIRIYLARTGYPQLGNGTFHIAHALWGGLLLLTGLATALLFVAARRTAAVLGGVGLGLFIDEVGKLVSRQHDYFFPLAPALIYLVFAALLVWSVLWDRDRKPATQRSGTASAAQIAVEGLSNGLSAEERRTADHLLGDRDDRAARAVRELLASAPEQQPPPWHATAWSRLVARARVTATRPAVQETVLGLFLVTRLVIPVTVVIRLIVLLAGGSATQNGGLDQLGALLGSLAAGLVSATFAVRAARRWRDDPLASCRWFKAAVLVDLLVVAVFNFAASQWAALAFLPANLVVLALVSGLIRHGCFAEQRRGLLTAAWTLASRTGALLPRLRLPTCLLRGLPRRPFRGRHLPRRPFRGRHLPRRPFRGHLTPRRRRP
jgi:hypothetical protein